LRQSAAVLSASACFLLASKAVCRRCAASPGCGLVRALRSTAAALSQLRWRISTSASTRKPTAASGNCAWMARATVSAWAGLFSVMASVAWACITGKALGAMSLALRTAAARPVLFLARA